ncbi:hypothetical protein ACFLSJ_01205 [Verrucomicrobiota bacterium]
MLSRIPRGTWKMATAFRVAAVVLCLSTAPAGPLPTQPAPSRNNGLRRYCTWFTTCLDELEDNLPNIATTVEAAAQRYVSVPSCGIGASGEPGFVEEWYERAGGIMAVKRFEDIAKAPVPAVILHALREERIPQDMHGINAQRARGNFIVVFGRADLLQAARDAGLAADAAVTLPAAHHGGLFPPSSPGGEALVPTDPTAAVAALWVWTGEFIAACTRQGKMPPIFLSYELDPSRVRAKRYAGKAFHDAVPRPIGAAVLGREYLRRARQTFQQVTTEHAEDLRTIAGMALDTLNRDHRLYTYAHGHAIQKHVGIRHDPGYFRQINTGWHRLIKDIELRPGDFVLCIGYNEIFRHTRHGRFAQKCRRQGISLAWSLAGYNEREIAAIQPGEPFVDQMWPRGDAVIALPGYDVSALPLSGLMSEAVFWMLNAEIHVRAARTGTVSERPL